MQRGERHVRGGACRQEALNVGCEELTSREMRFRMRREIFLSRFRISRSRVKFFLLARAICLFKSYESFWTMEGCETAWKREIRETKEGGRGRYFEQAHLLFSHPDRRRVQVSFSDCIAVFEWHVVLGGCSFYSPQSSPSQSCRRFFWR